MAQSVRTPTVGLVGGNTLLGRELRELLAAPGFPARVRLIAEEDAEAGALTEQAGEPAVIHLLDSAALAESDVTLFAGSAASTRKALSFAFGTPVIDASCAAGEAPQARLRAPFLESAALPAVPGALDVIAHPAAIALALFLRQLSQRYPVVKAVTQILAPVGERGFAGLEELQEQSTNLLVFKSLPKAVFDAQAAFNLLARYGDQAPEPLEATEALIDSHLATLLSWEPRAPMPSLRAVQAPVFHGYSFSVWVQFESAPEIAGIEQALASAHIDVRGTGAEPPSIVSMAGESGIAVGAIERDRQDARAVWFWIAADTIRLAAENALAVVREALGE